MQPMTIQAIAQIVFIVWFGITLLYPVMTTTKGNDDE